MANSIVKVVVLGATGSVGQNTLDVISRHPDKFSVFAVSGHNNMTLLADVVKRFNPSIAVVPTVERRSELLALLSTKNTEILVGEDALVDIAQAPETDAVMAAIVGAAGLKSSLAAARAGKKLLLANKESLVVAGSLLMDAVKQNKASLLPIDSEHNAIFQCLPQDHSHSGVKSLLLTASGGPFRLAPLDQLKTVTPAQAVAHPNWSMGQKISVDSASLMNKGLELIEACWLFGVTPSDVEVVVHPQSIIHSMVRYKDGSVISQMGTADMRIPIAYGLAYPLRIESGAEHLKFDPTVNLTFDTPDLQRFPCLRLAREAMEAGGTIPAILNAANEITVDAFLKGHIGFMEIGSINESVMNSIVGERVESVEQLMVIDNIARNCAIELVRG